MRDKAPVSRRGPTSFSTSLSSRMPCPGGNMPTCGRMACKAPANAAAPDSARPTSPPIDVPTQASRAGRRRAISVTMSDTYCGTV
ncbi:hypothetical protein G6F35_017671 [Rhizopus arrhizus]|nr:hypothetical protein G6F35_017671 [Rhizopus arrhizus]